jgi:hypothetical protein
MIMNSLLKNIQYKGQQKVLVYNAPEDVMPLFSGFIPHADKAVQGKYSFILFFARNKADINHDSSWELFKPWNFSAVSQVAIDEDWSGLRFRDSSLIKKQKI